MAEHKGSDGSEGTQVEETREGEYGVVSRLVEDSGTESGEDRRGLEEEAVEEVRGALEKLRVVLPKLAGRLGGSVTDLVAKLQSCLPSPTPPPRFRKQRRYHTVSVTAEEIARARNWLDKTAPKRCDITRCEFRPVELRAGCFMEPAPQTAVLSYISPPPPVTFDPSTVLFTPEQSVQIAVHKAAIKKQISREEVRRKESDSELSSSDEEVSSPQRLLQLAAEPRVRHRKHKIKRSNTIDIPRPATYYETSDTASADEMAYSSDRAGLKRKSCGALFNKPPDFVPKTENDLKFLSFLSQVSDNSQNKVITYNPSARGGKHWSSRFSRIKTAFEEVSGDEKETVKDKKPSYPPQKSPATHNKLPWSVKQEGDVIVGSITVAKRVPGPVNQFTHAPLSAFKPVEKKTTSFPSSVSGSVKQLASQKFSPNVQPKVVPTVPPRTHSKNISQNNFPESNPLSERFVPNKSASVKQYPAPQAYLNQFSNQQPPHYNYGTHHDNIPLKSPSKIHTQETQNSVRQSVFHLSHNEPDKKHPSYNNNNNNNNNDYNWKKPMYKSENSEFAKNNTSSVYKNLPHYNNILNSYNISSKHEDKEPIYQNVPKKSLHSNVNFVSNSEYIPKSNDSQLNGFQFDFNKPLGHSVQAFDSYKNSNNTSENFSNQYYKQSTQILSDANKTLIEESLKFNKSGLDEFENKHLSQFESSGSVPSSQQSDEMEVKSITDYYSCSDRSEQNSDHLFVPHHNYSPCIPGYDNKTPSPHVVYNNCSDSGLHKYESRNLYDDRLKYQNYVPNEVNARLSPNKVYNLPYYEDRNDVPSEVRSPHDLQSDVGCIEEKAVMGRVMGEAQCQRGAVISQGRTRHRSGVPLAGLPPQAPSPHTSPTARLVAQLSPNNLPKPTSPTPHHPAKPLSPQFPNVLQKSESWHQMVKEQMQQAKQAPPIPKVVKTKSSHSLAFPKQFEASLNPESLHHKQSTVSQYLKKTSSSIKTTKRTTDLDEVENVDEAFESIFQEANVKKNSK